ncbi:type VI secretion system-associated FHA domain protein TagH [Rhizobium laguerreae]|uniref:type VI secretion system-associated FHA domain protein TagH n=1 Tax=Rhizobium laguerreae TaxID=1076926 RepID=UPI001C9129AE|nr:type VI secretion system-associated FHA domain protein TagH [Rhizobium laguerreae]MBY3347996.1 type VI secretion system-associated FHA domain protein TagH [Rhizobium laguerreae]MBY3354959.1 type VI secretion system-associated FHA domain protein TagH [Rhizobium laguerreae]MBY3376264.1 type VI secretion system-associated FHA domain protein TagH [Rhizobium laguerreae]MBY3431263.1 type VI secretion system-associated FHA domain protein TagH [Rhizobium laguerreae]MBY3439878.1 type VI secretion sy
MSSITLRITNVDRLPDGGPTIFTTADDRFEIGRDPFREWTLPDPQRHVSGRHCEIMKGPGGYVLNDISRNGTFVNGAQQRVKSPYLLQNGDMLMIGDYVIIVQLTQVASAPSSSGDWANGDDDDMWGAGPSSREQQDRRLFEPEARRPATPDFVGSHLDLPRSDVAPRQSEQNDDVFAGFSPKDIAAGSRFDRSSISAGESAIAGSQRAASEEPVRSRDQGRYQRNDEGQLYSNERLLAAFCQGAGLAPDMLKTRDAEDLFRELGSVVLMLTGQTSLLLRARASAKAMVRTSNRTMIEASNNNPLKFMADPAEALQIMLARDRAGYLDTLQSFRSAFDDLKKHELATYAAMQKALSRLLADLAPEAVEAKVNSGPFSNRKAKAWETFVSRWEAKTEANANGMLDVFLTYFAEAYQEFNSRSE